MTTRTILLPLIVTTVSAMAQNSRIGVLYTLSNQPKGNEVIIFDRMSDGALVRTGSVPTGGEGTGAGLGNQGAVAMSPDQRWLFVVNAASNNIASFEVLEDGLRLVDLVASGGKGPVSITVFRNYVYVLNAGSDTIAGFELADSGRLTPWPGTARALSGVNTGAAQISFSMDGDLLVVTEKATNRIVIYRVNPNGHPSGPIIHNSVGHTPFGFSFGTRHRIFVSEAADGVAGHAAMTSYQLSDDGDLEPISTSVMTNQTSACWVVLGVEKPFAFTSNADSNTISSYRMAFDGSLTVQQAVSTTTGNGPIDMAMSPSGTFLYALNASGSIGVYRVQDDGTLTAIPGNNSGLPAGVNGLAIR